jgi:hypothetical protein
MVLVGRGAVGAWGRATMAGVAAMGRLSSVGDDMVGLSSLLCTTAAETVYTRAAMRGCDWPAAAIAAVASDSVLM